jgi:phenylacetic acid degradation operon negative regulatory protein
MVTGSPPSAGSGPDDDRRRIDERANIPVSFPQRPPAALASVLGLRQDNSVSVDTSRALLLTTLGEFVLPHGGRAWTQTLVGLLELLDVRDKAVRQAVSRMHRRGWLDREKIGRQTRWSLTAESRGLLEPGARRIYAFGQDQRLWNHSWVVVLASVPERDRHLRYRLATGLNWAGFGSIGQGIWLSPWHDRERDAVELFNTLGIDATTFRAELGELGDPRRLADQAWDISGLREQYDSFLRDTDPIVDWSLRGDEAAAALTTIVHRWRRFPFIDPDLPGDLLPDDWPGPRAARRFADLRDALRPEAFGWWADTERALAPNT